MSLANRLTKFRARLQQGVFKGQDLLLANQILEDAGLSASSSFVDRIMKLNADLDEFRELHVDGRFAIPSESSDASPEERALAKTLRKVREAMRAGKVQRNLPLAQKILEAFPGGVVGRLKRDIALFRHPPKVVDVFPRSRRSASVEEKSLANRIAILCHGIKANNYKGDVELARKFFA